MCHRAKRQSALIQVVEEPPRRSNDNVNAQTQLAGLWIKVNTAKDYGRTQR